MAKAKKKTALKVKFKGQSFEVTRQQQAAFNALPRTLKSRLRAPDGKPLSAAHLKELGKAVEILKEQGEVASTIMCPW